MMELALEVNMEMVPEVMVSEEERLLKKIEEVGDNERLKLKGIKFFGFRSLEKCPLIVELLWRADRRGGLMCLLRGKELKKGFKEFLRGLDKEDGILLVDVKVEVSEREVVIEHEEGMGEDFKREVVVFERRK